MLPVPEVPVQRPILLVLGVLLVLAGAVWTLQGLDLLGQSGGMNGQTQWAVIGPVVVIGGLAAIVRGIRAGR